MIKRVHHIGVAVKDLEEARGFFSDSFGLAAEDAERFGELAFSFLSLHGASLELLQSTTPEGTMSKFIEKRGTGVHHIAFEVDDVQAELDRLKRQGLQLIHEKPYLNAHEELVAFIHPKSSYGVLIELVQSNSE